MSEILKNINHPKKNLPMILIILDGWGIDKPNEGNAITLANTKNINELSKKFPYTKLYAHGKHVGLPPKQDGNSEAGHMNIGAGRVTEQDAVKIGHSISDGTFFKNLAFLEAVKHAKENKSKVHLMGMLANEMSAHSDPDHLLALIEMLKIQGIKDIYIHLFTDGRDSPKYEAQKLIVDLQKNMRNGEQIASIMGRLYAMDRTKKWDRTKMAYEALVSGKGRFAETPNQAITESYNRSESDEFIEPYVIGKNISKSRISDNDSIIFFNLRSDRARQLTKAFVQDDFNKLNPGSFKRKKVLKNIRFVTMTDFGPDLDSILTAFPSVDLKGTLPMVLSNLTQAYVAETEKYAHVTYFFNGGYSGKVDSEVQFMISSPNVKNYEVCPEMSSKELMESVLDNLKKKRYDFTVLNFAAPDMIGHTGNLQAGVKCCTAVDKYAGEIAKAYLNAGGTAIITADHGNVENMINLKTGEFDTEHSSNQVPFILVNNSLHKNVLRKNGVLADIAPTILDLLGMKKPKEMTGKSLII